MSSDLNDELVQQDLDAQMDALFDGTLQYACMGGEIHFFKHGKVVLALSVKEWSLAYHGEGRLLIGVETPFGSAVVDVTESVLLVPARTIS